MRSTHNVAIFMNSLLKKNMKKIVLLSITTFGMVMLLCQLAFAQDDDIAKKLANPISSLISVPIQANYDDNIGLNDNGSVWRVYRSI